MKVAGEAPLVPEGLDALLPPWAQQLSLLGILLIIVGAFIRGWVLTRSQAERELEAERKIGLIWKSNYEQSVDLNQQLTSALQPVLDSSAAILKIVESLQAWQAVQEQRYERDTWLRNRRDPQG